MSYVVKDLIPQREPFLFIDEIVEYSDGEVVTSFTPGEERDFFKGHFPGNPVLPGVIIQEAVFQSGAALMGLLAKDQAGSGLGVVTRVESAKFKNMVKPGEKLMISVKIDEQLENAFYMRGKVTKEGKTVLAIKFACASV